MTVLAPEFAAAAGNATTTRLFAAASATAEDHRATFGELPAVSADSVREQIESSGLAGRGGAGFPTWRKLAAGLDTAAGRVAGRSPGAERAPTLIANGAEGEPLSAKDATLLRRAPHLVLDGLLLAGRAIGAGEIRLGAAADQLTSIRAALAERDDVRVTLTETPGTFLSGEASALVHQIDRGRSVPRDHPVRLALSGLRGRPTVVLNVETLAHLALVARFGANWFRSVGSPDDPGTRLVSVSGDGPSPRVLEVVGGAPVASILRAAGVDPDSLRAVLIGGYHGSWLDGSDLGLPLSPAGLAVRGGHPGAGVMFTVRRGRCGLRAGADIAGYLAAQSARQCGPCANGLPRIATVLERLVTHGETPGLDAELRRLADSVSGRGACHHPDGTARFVLSTLEVFASDVECHLRGECEETG